MCTALGRSCPQLTTLEVKFDRYSIPSELFTNAGLIELTERCTALTHLSLRNTNITDRALYAVAANCKRLSSLRVGGYHECISDAGMTILVSACSATLTRLQLSSKLTRVSDVTMQCLANSIERHAAEGIPCPLTTLKLTAATTDAGLQHLTRALGITAAEAASKGSKTRMPALAATPKVADTTSPGLRHLDIGKCSLVSAGAVKQLLLACPRLLTCKLPVQVL
ncbi:MAG: hypothetical protein WDW38_011123 [Sanguina aurantia]